MELDRDKVVHMLRLMYRIRHFEERLTPLYDYQSFLKKGDTAGDEYDFHSTGIIAGAVHLSVGQEGVAVGVCAALDERDSLSSTHRGHGHAIARGAQLKPMMAELMGRETGYSRGCGGSMHILDADLGLLGGNGIVGAQIPIAAGAAFAEKVKGTGGVSVAFFSEGASNEGAFHEALNMAALWDLPVIFVCENNLYGASTPAEISLSTPDIADRAAGYGMPGKIVDGQDVLAVYDAASEAVERARAGQGPTLLECKTYRFYAHCGAGRPHNNPEELKGWRDRDPITLLEQRLQADGQMTADEQQAMRDEVAAQVEEAVEFASKSPFPTFERLQLDGVPEF